MARIRRRSQVHPLIGAATLTLLVALLCISLQQHHWFQPLELIGYDRLMRLQHGDAKLPVPVVIVQMNEKDIQAYGQYPVSDFDLAALLQKLLDQHPRVIGVDIFRDLPVPKLGVPNDGGSATLDALLRNRKNTSLIWGIAADGEPPRALQHYLKSNRYPVIPRVGFTDVEPDPDTVLRRIMLRVALDPLSENPKLLLSLDLQMAAVFLSKEQPPLLLQPLESVMTFGGKPIPQLAAGDGPYSTIDTSGYQQLLDCRHHYTFSHYSFHDMLDPARSPPESAVKDAIVLVGIDAETVRDHFATPLAAAEPGVDIHAQAIEQLIATARGEQQPFYLWHGWQKIAWVALWTVLGGLLGYTFRSIFPFLIGALLGVSLLGFIAWHGLSAGYWVPLVAPTAAWLMSAVITSSYLFYRERLDRSALMSLFAKHVSRDVAETIWQRRDEFFADGYLVPRVQEATVLFTDLRDFTTLSERLEPQDLIRYINEYMDVMSAVVTQHHGSVNKYIGDAIMALFGAPIPSTSPTAIADNATDAVRCALAMRQQLTRLNAKWSAAQEKIGEINMRVGIYTGRLVAGSVGGVDRLEYTVIGDTVNIASRLESYDKDLMAPDIAAYGCRILIGGRTQELVAHAVRTRLIGEVKLKGRNVPIAVYGVIAETTSDHDPESKDGASGVNSSITINADQPLALLHGSQHE